MKSTPEDIRYIIIPDVHGRTFWKNAQEIIANNPNINIIFLGDYLDPYHYEDITFENALENFKEILDFANKYKSQVTLLVGNHDMSYIGEPSICKCRHDYTYHTEAKRLFKDNASSFKLYHLIKEIGNDKKILFSHSVLSKMYYEHCTELPCSDLNTFVIQQNNLLYNALTENEISHETKTLYKNLSIVSLERGGYSMYGSSIWEDINAFLKNDSIWFENIDMIVGHTQLVEKSPIEISNIDLKTWAIDLDCRKSFILTNTNEIKGLNEDINILKYNSVKVKTKKRF